MSAGRVLAKSISTSAKLAELSCDGARLLFTWMIAHQDPLGRLPGEPLQVKALVLPRHASSIEDVEGWLSELSGVGLIAWYTHQGLRYVQITNPQVKLSGNMKRRSDLPGPDGSSTYDVRTLCVPDVDVDVDVDVEVKPFASSDEDRSPPPAVSFPTKGGSWSATSQDLDRWAKAYPEVDVPSELQRMAVWLDANPTKRKTPRGMKRFVVAWLSRSRSTNGGDQSDPYGPAWYDA